MHIARYGNKYARIQPSFAHECLSALVVPCQVPDQPALLAFVNEAYRTQHAAPDDGAHLDGKGKHGSSPLNYVTLKVT